MQIIKKVLETIYKFNLISPQDHILVALSGGADSVCLLRILTELKASLKITLSSAYINHGLRPNEIPNEIDFCKRLCDILQIPFYTQAITITTKGNLQEQARTLRLEALNEIAYQIKANKIALAHHADDQAETVLMRLCSGAGLRGLAGIPILRQNIIRPLLFVSRHEIEEFHRQAKIPELDIAFVTDSSNTHSHYSRNHIRHKVLPELKKLYPQLLSTIAHTSSILKEEDRYLDILTTKTMMRMISRKSDDFIELFLLPLKATDLVIARRILRRAIEATRGLKSITFSHIEDILGLLQRGSSGDRLYLPHGIRVILKYSTVLITSLPPAKLSTYSLHSAGDYPLIEAGVVLKISYCDSLEQTHCKDTAYFDADKVRFPLTVRARQAGDKFIPAGLSRHKKLQDFFVDEKVPRDERDAVPIVTNADGQIIWVASMRADERFAVDKKTKRILKFQVAQMKQ